MLFRKKIEPRCAYCTKGSPLNEKEVACVKRGIVSSGGSCRRTGCGRPEASRRICWPPWESGARPSAFCWGLPSVSCWRDFS